VATKPQDVLGATGAAPAAPTGGLAAPGGSIAGAMKGMTSTAFSPNFTSYTPGNDSVEGRVAGLISSSGSAPHEARGAAQGSTGRQPARPPQFERSRSAPSAGRSAEGGDADCHRRRADIAAQKNLAAMSETGQNERLTADAGFQSERIGQQGDVQSRLQEEQGRITGGLNQAQYDAQFKQLQTSLAADLQKLNMQIASAEGQQKSRPSGAGRPAPDAGPPAARTARGAGRVHGSEQMQAAVRLYDAASSSSRRRPRSNSSTPPPRPRCPGSRRSSRPPKGSRGLDIQAQMERLQVDVKAESDRLAQAAGYDMSRLQAQGCHRHPARPQQREERPRPRESAGHHPIAAPEPRATRSRFSG
jgi:hypothetical protein